MTDSPALARSEPRVAVYIDFDNIVISRYNQLFGRGAFGTDGARNFTMGHESEEKVPKRLADARVDVSAILDYASSFGTMVISRAFADWSAAANASYQRQLVNRAVDLTQLFSVTAQMKNGADIRLAVDVVEDLFRLGDITHVVIVAGDSDYIALAQRCKRLGRHVVGIGVAGATSRSLMAACDEFTDYDDLPGVTRPEIVAPAGDKANDKPTRSRRASSTVTTPPAEPQSTQAPSLAAQFTSPEFPAEEAVDVSPQDAATDLLHRALQIVGARGDEEWAYNAEVKNQMIRMDPAFKEKSLGFPTFSAFIESRPEVVEVKVGATANEPRLKLR